MNPKQLKGKDLQFISWIRRDGSGTDDMKNTDMAYLDEEVFNLNCLSLSEKTWIASAFNSFVVKIKIK